MEKQKKYNLKDEKVFKDFFTKKENEKFLIDFLESLLKIDIAELKINTENENKYFAISEKGTIFQADAVLKNGTIANIIIQIKNESKFELKTIYSCSDYIKMDNLKYGTTKKTIIINILGYNMFEDYEDYISKSAIVLENHRESNVINNIEWWFIELPKFRKKHPDMDEKINQWIAFIDDEDEELVKLSEEKNTILQKARIEINTLTHLK